MRILWVSHFLPYPPTGGVLQRGYGLVSRLASHCEVHLLAMHQPRLFNQTGAMMGLDTSAALAELNKYCASAMLIDIPAEVRPMGRHIAAIGAVMRRRSYTEQWLSSTQAEKAVGHAIRRTRADLVHFDTISLAPYTRGHSGIRLSLGHHNVESHMMWRRSMNANNALAARLLKVEARRILQLERRYAPAVDLNVVCSEIDARRLRRITKAPHIHVAENGVLAPEVHTEAIQSTAPTTSLLFVGRMSAYTNSDAAEFLVRDIWPVVARRCPALRLDLVGSGAPEAAHKLAAQDSRVKVHGFLADLSGVHHPGSLFVCPVRDGGGTKLKILDAMNRGLAIVAHPTALEGIGARNGEHVLLARTPHEFAAAIASLVNSTSERRRLAENAHALVRERYTFDAIATRLFEKFRWTVQMSKHSRTR